MKIKITEFQSLLAAGITILVIGTAFLFWICKIENLPTFFVAVIALGLSYLSYINARDKVRLDLFKQRFESYQHCLNVCSIILRHGKMPEAEKFLKDREAFEKSAHESFRGTGYHYSYFIFGKDIRDLYEEINTMYAFLSAHPDSNFGTASDIERQDSIEKKYRYLRRTLEIIDQMPIMFSKYLDMSKYIQK